MVCPSCGSSRVRNGYRPAPLPLRLLGIRELLCDNCNLLYRGFSPLPPRKSKPRHPDNTFNHAPAGTFNSRPRDLAGEASPPAKFDGAAVSGSKDPPLDPAPKMAPRAIVSPGEVARRPRRRSPSPPCPRCGSTETRRRRRRLWERLLYGRRPYLCHGCGESFYARRPAEV